MRSRRIAGEAIQYVRGMIGQTMPPSFPPKSILAALLLLVSIAASSALDPWRNTSLPIPERVADLVSRLSLPEKGLLLSSTTPAIERLGIPAFNWGTECLHGVADSVLPATVFPSLLRWAHHSTQHSHVLLELQSAMKPVRFIMTATPSSCSFSPQI